jgi:hypothetical protein
LFFLVTVVTAFLIVALCPELTGFAACYASSIHWSTFFHVVIIVLYRHLVLMFDQIAYQAISFLFARHCFLVVVVFSVWGSLLKRTFLHSIGISVAHSLLLAATVPIYFLAKLP